MFNNLTLYYLNQLGITPWISKENSLNISMQSEPRALASGGLVNLRDKTNLIESRALKLVVLISSELNDKAQSLFNRMMSYINIPNDELMLLNMQQHDINAKHNWFSQITDKVPLAILALGPSAKALFDEFNPPVGVVESLTLDDLLSNPSNKKKVFQDLNYLKQLLS